MRTLRTLGIILFSVLLVISGAIAGTQYLDQQSSSQSFNELSQLIGSPSSAPAHQSSLTLSKPADTAVAAFTDTALPAAGSHPSSAPAASSPPAAVSASSLAVTSAALVPASSLATLSTAFVPATQRERVPADPAAYAKYQSVHALNNDLIGWLSIEGTAIDFPVMQTKDRPNHYLTHNFEGKTSKQGVPYVSENSEIDISDNTIIYGHNMRSGAMFADLTKFTSQRFYKAHKTIRFDTLRSFGEYEVVAVFKTPVYTENDFEYYGFTHAASAADFDAFVARVKSMALYDTGITPQYGDQLLTLSTCEYSQPNGRLVILAKRIVSPTPAAT